MKTSTSALALLAAGLLAGCAFVPGVRSETETAAAPPSWSGPPRPSSTGDLDVAAFNAYLERRVAPSALAPKEIATLFLLLDLEEPPSAERPKTSLVETRTGDRSAVTVERTGLADDSVRAERYVLELEQQAAGMWRLVSARRTQRCQPGRGHQSFSPELCV